MDKCIGLFAKVLNPRAGWALLAILLVSQAQALDLPKPSGYVNDFAGVLDPAARQDLAQRVHDLKTQTAVQASVVTVTSLQGLTVEEYANRLFKTWGIGEKGKDNGILILVCPSEHKMRIEIGYGLEAIINDAKAGTVIREDMTPAFRRGDYATGLKRGVERLASLLGGHERIADMPALESAADANVPPPILMMLFVGLFVIMGSTISGKAMQSRDRFLLAGGAAFAGVPLGMCALFCWLFYFGKIFWPFWTLLGIGAGMFCLAWAFGARWKLPMGGSGGSSASTWSPPRSGSSSSSSSSHDDDFGGGSSGGGGASGSW